MQLPFQNGFLVRFVIAAVTIFVAVLMLLFLPIIAEAWALLRVEQIMNGVDFWLGLAAVVLLIVNVAIVLLLWHGFAESLPETGAAIGTVVLPLLQDLEKQSTATSTDDVATEETPAPNGVN